MPEPTSLDKRPERLYEIDLVRCIASSFVVIYHLGFRGFADEAKYMHVEYPEFAWWAKYLTGINFFFMTTGFALVLGLHRQSPGAFVLGRARRIYPTLWICCILSTLGFIVLGRSEFVVPPWDFVLNMTLLAGFVSADYVDGAYWTIKVSIQFFMIIWGVLMLRQLPRLPWFLAGWLGLSAINAIAPFPSALQEFLVTEFAHYFVAGATAALLWKSPKSVGLWALYIATLPLALLDDVHRSAHRERLYNTDLNPWVMPMFSIFYFALFAAIALNWTARFRWPIFQRIAIASFPVFLLHQYLGYAYLDVIQGPKYLVLLSFIVGLIAAGYAIELYAVPWLTQKVFGSKKKPRTAEA